MSTYQTTRNSQGHLVVHGVPIFMDCQRDEMVFNRAWVEQAVATARQAADDGYYPPLHVRHHGFGEDVRPAGFFEITHSEEITFRGKRRLAIIADLTVTAPDVEWDILETRLPYRSVEIMRADRPNIDSLALLDHEAPYLELPMLKAVDPGPRQGSGTPAASFALATIAQHYRAAPSMDDGGVVACMSRGQGATILFDHREDSDMSVKTTDKQEAAPKGDDTTKVDERVHMADDGADKGDDDGEKMEAEEAGLDVGSICKAIESGEISVADMDAIMAAIAAQKGAGEAMEGEMEDPTEVKEPVPGAAMKAGELATTVAKLQARNEVLEAKFAAREEQDKRTSDVAAAMTRLKGIPLGSDLEERLERFHRAHGGEAFSAYVDEMERGSAAIGASDFGQQRAADNEVPAASTAVEAYAEQGPEALAQAAKFSAMWKDIQAAGNTRMSEERYIQLNMGR